MITLLTGCSTEDVTLTTEEKTERLMLGEYTARCEAVVKTKLTENTYSYICKRYEDGRYTVEYDGMTLTVDDYDAVISKDGIEIKTKISKDEIALLPTYFFTEYLKEGSMEPIESGYVLKSEISGNNPYRCSAEMILNEDITPRRINIKDKNGNIVIGVEITDFSN